MIILVQRYLSSKDWTLSKVLINGRQSCWGVEDEKREKKILHETRIPEGTYKVTLRTFGSHHESYKIKFPEHKGMLWVRDVPGFQDILIHIGNDDDDTSGCLLLGSRRDETRGEVYESTIAYRKFYKQVLAAIEAGEEVIITYEDKENA